MSIVFATPARVPRLSSPSGVRADGDTWEDVFFRIMFKRIEHRLGVGRPTSCANTRSRWRRLARAKPGDPKVAEHFELYACGVELANAFGELTDPDIQRNGSRPTWTRRTALRGALAGRRAISWPRRHGLPDCAGSALGLRPAGDAGDRRQPYRGRAVAAGGDECGEGP